MGSSSEYKCKSCGHHFISMGGPNVTKQGLTESTICSDCGQIFERLIRIGAYEFQPGEIKDNPECKHCGSRKIHCWTIELGCPKCFGELQELPLCCSRGEPLPRTP